MKTKSKEKENRLVFATWFKGDRPNEVGYIAAKDEYDLQKICKKRYSGKLVKWKSLGKFIPGENKL